MQVEMVKVSLCAGLCEGLGNIIMDISQAFE